MARAEPGTAPRPAARWEGQDPLSVPGPWGPGPALPAEPPAVSHLRRVPEVWVWWERTRGASW